MKNTFDSPAVMKAKMDNQIVTKTLDAVNSISPKNGKKKSFASAQKSMSDSFELNKSILSAAYEAKGAAITTKG